MKVLYLLAIIQIKLMSLQFHNLYYIKLIITLQIQDLIKPHVLMCLYKLSGS